MDTIFALASAQGKAGIAVVRISGPSAFRAAESLAGPLPGSGRGVRTLIDRQGQEVDQGYVLCFPDGRSFTGEPVVELHLHGSVAVVSRVLDELGDLPDLRMAEPGEFTRRALENGRLDLAQVEGLADLVDAETEAQRRQAMRVLSGALGEKAARWRAGLVRAAALIEATIDFVDEDVPVDVGPEVGALLDDVRIEMIAEANGVHIAERIRSGFEVAIVGAPNVGKSTLLNRLAGREAAITSARAGTTRDVIEVRLDLDGLAVTILDTAGLRESDDEIERLGVDRARRRAAEADLRIYLMLPGDKIELEIAKGDLVVGAKADLGETAGMAVSGLSGAGIEELVAAISAELRGRSSRAGLAMRERHRLAMTKAVGYLDAAQVILGDDGPADLAAEELRNAIRAVDSLVGRVDVEELLGEIFASFCIGK
jgi:tRNA modification GTPase